MAARTEVLGDGTRGRKEALSVARGLEPLHPLLPLAGRLVGVLGAVIEIPLLAMLDSRKNFPLGCFVALQFVGDDDPWYIG